METLVLTSERDGSETAHLLEMVAILEMSLQIRADGALTCVSIHYTLFPLWHKSVIHHQCTDQAIMENSHRTSKEMLLEQKGDLRSSKDSLNHALLT